MKSFCFLFVLILSIGSAAQEAKSVDSLQAVFQSSVADSTKILVLCEIAKQYYRSKPDTTLILAAQAARWAEELDYTRGKAKSYNIIGLAYWVKSDHSQALTYFQKGVALFTEVSDQNGLGFGLNNIGLIYYYENDFSTGLNYFQRALHVHEGIDSKDGIGMALNNIGLCHEAQNDLSSALVYYLRAQKVYQEANIKVGIAQSLTNIGYIYFAQQNYSQALDNLQKAQIIQQEISDYSTWVSTLIGIAQVYQSQKQYDACIRYASQALEIAKENKLPYDAMTASHVLYEAYQSLRKYDMALQYFQLNKQLNDSIFSIEKSKAIATMEAKLELAEKQKEVEALEKGKERQQKVTILIIGGLLLVGVFAFAVLRNRKKIQAAYSELETTNQNLRNAKSEIELQADLLKKSNKTKDKIFSIVSHDLRSPLNALKGAVGLMESGYMTPEEFKGLIPDLSKRLAHATDITEEVLHWSRNQINAIEPKPVSILLEAIFLKKTERFKQPATDKRVTLQIALPDRSLSVFADEDMLKTVLRNLISNAIKFTNKGGVITLGADLSGDKITLRVEDNGVGIDQASMSKIFNDQGFTTEGTEGEHGTGLGLKLCKEFVEKNGGQIWVKSEMGKGTTFFFTLPKGE